MYRKSKKDMELERNIGYSQMLKVGESDKAREQFRRKPYCTISTLEYAKQKGVNVDERIYADGTSV